MFTISLDRPVRCSKPLDLAWHHEHRHRGSVLQWSTSDGQTTFTTTGGSIFVTNHLQGHLLPNLLAGWQSRAFFEAAVFTKTFLLMHLLWLCRWCDGYPWWRHPNWKGQGGRLYPCSWCSVVVVAWRSSMDPSWPPIFLITWLQAQRRCHGCRFNGNKRF